MWPGYRDWAKRDPPLSVPDYRNHPPISATIPRPPRSPSLIHLAPITRPTAVAPSYEPYPNITRLASEEMSVAGSANLPPQGTTARTLRVAS